MLDRPSARLLQIDSLDGLRAIAVILVLLSHLSEAGIHLVPGVSFAGTGKYGVFLFFVLSAFLLTRPFLTRNLDSLGKASTWLAYIAKRVARIWPLYSFVLVAHWALAPGNYHTRLSPQELAAHFTLQSGDGVFWTIPVEFKYYLFLPLVVLTLARVRDSRWWLCAVVGIQVGGIAAASLWLPAQYPTIALAPFLPIFLSGSSAALVHWKLQNRGGIQSQAMRCFLEASAACCFLYVILFVSNVWNFNLGDPVGTSYFLDNIITLGALWSLFIVAYLNGTGTISRMLSIKPLRFIGVVSFGVYLWHMPVLFFVQSNFSATPSLQAGAVIVMTLLIASFSYVGIERPCSRSVSSAWDWLAHVWGMRAGAPAGRPEALLR